MRALVLIVFCVFLLVVVQASYLVIEAKQPDDTKTRATVGTEGTDHAHKSHQRDESSKVARIIEDQNRLKPHKSLKHSYHRGNPLVPPGEKEIHYGGVPIINMTINHSEKHSKADDSDIYEQMLGDAPISDSMEHGHRKGSKKRINGTKHSKKNKKLHKKGRFNQSKGKLGTTCDHDDDCGVGKCCVETHKGQHICKSGSFKPLGKRCLTSCVCQEGLKCYINDSHQSKKKKKSFHRTLGHCVDPSKAKEKNGYRLVDSQTTSTTNPLAPSSLMPGTP